MLFNTHTTRILVLSLSFVFYLTLQAQTTSVPFLERRISLTAINQPTEKILKQLSEQTGCVFSYSPQSVNVQNTSTVAVSNKPLKVVLKDVFGNNVNYKIRGKYIILKKSKESTKSTEPKILEGYIYDKQSGRQLTEASIYDKKSRLSTITNQYGYFRIEVPQAQLASSLCVSKAGYSDTLLLSSTLNSYKRMMEVTLNTNTTKQESGISFRKFLPKWLLPRKIGIHSNNLTDSLFRKVQLSLMPMVNTNALLTGNTKNDWSINLTVGYVYAIQKCELGAGINIVRTNAGICQLAGVGNMVGGYSYGFQGAGGFNMAHDAFGIQSAGVINIVSNKANIQTSGGMNVAGDANIQISGALNLAKDTSLIQVAGGINRAGQTTVQLAGAVNIAQNATFLQLTSGLNYASESSNIQISGCVNKAKMVNVQIGAVNIAKRSATLQLGIVNIADSCSGIPLGLFSYIRSGYHCLEISMDEASFATIAYRSGVQRFHSFFSAGILIRNFNDKLFTYGFGLGTSLGNPHKCLIDIDLSTNQFATSRKLLSDGNQFKLYGGIDKRLTRHLTLAAGVSYNVLLNKTTSTDDQLIYSKLVPYTLTNQELNNNTNLRTWIGGKVALRFL